MKKYNMSSIFKAAWKLFRKLHITFADALRVAWTNAKLHNLIKEAAAVTEETHSWSGWRQLGYEVRHGSSALYKVVTTDPTTKTGTRIKAYFGFSQVQPIPEA